MPKFAKGSPEAVEFMKQLREKRGPNRPMSTKKTVKKEHIKKIVNEALENYFMSGTPIVEIPSQVVKVDKSGKGKLVDTLTKAGNLKKINGENVIQLESGNALVVKSEGNKYNDVVNISPQTIVHKTELKKTRANIKPTVKEFNDVIDVKNEIIPIQKILHNPHQKSTKTRPSIEPYNDLIVFDNVDIEPLIKKTMKTTKMIKTRPK